jgi:hypothetical protein
VITIGTYEVPIWAKQGWLVPLDDLGAEYDVDDLLPPIRAGLSYEDKLYAAPFYGESSMIMYRTDLFQAAGITMPESPTWEFIAESGQEADRQGQGDLRRLHARQGRMGREHRLHHHRRKLRSAPAGSTRTGSRSSTSRPGRKPCSSMSTCKRKPDLRVLLPTASTRTLRSSMPANAPCGSTPRWRPPS